jgi:hypothetical protein
MSKYECGKCGTHVGIMNMARQRDYRDKITHITCPTPKPFNYEPPTTPVKFRVKVRAFCRPGDQQNHNECSGIQVADDKRSAYVCSCDCHVADEPTTLDASFS